MKVKLNTRAETALRSFKKFLKEIEEQKEEKKSPLIKMKRRKNDSSINGKIRRQTNETQYMCIWNLLKKETKTQNKINTIKV